MADYGPERDKLKEICLMQGEFRISGDRNIALTTLLGSCVATCIFDPKALVGGMNHFLLATSSGLAERPQNYGVHAMDELIEGLFRMGAARQRLQAKVFGGATIEEKMAQIGQENARFALSYLDKEAIPVVASSLGGSSGRKIFFVPTTGHAWQRLMDEPACENPLQPPFHQDTMLFED